MKEWDPTDYNNGYSAGKAAAENEKASDALMYSVFALFGSISLLILLFCPGIFVAWLILEKYRVSGKLKGWNYFWVMLTIILVLEILTVLFKTLSNWLRARDNWLWILPWLIYFLYCFVLPGLLVHTFVYDMFERAPGRPTDTLNIISWVLGLVAACLVYSRAEGQFRRVVG